MKKPVLVTVIGKCKQKDSDWDNIELMTTGNLYDKNGSLFVTYDEILDENNAEDSVKHNRVKIEQNPLCVTITKSGIITSVMSFEENTKENSRYETPFGHFDMGIQTKKIIFEQDDKHLYLRLLYDLEMNFEFLSENDVTIDVKICEEA